MPRTQSNGIEIEYETLGRPEDPALVMVSGLGGQLISWPEELVRQLADAGFFVVLFDNRDAGLSTKFEGAPDIMSLLSGQGGSAPYQVEDMADDAAGLIEALGLGPAHVLGISMGGMISQALAIRHADRLLSVCSIMSTTGDRRVGAPSSEALTALMRPPPRGRAEAIEASVEGTRVISSPGFAFDEEWVRTRAAAAYDRCFCPEGTARQLGAILASPDRTAGLGAVALPFLVIHGEDDPLVNVSGGTATAAAVPGAELVLIAGMGHDLPRGAWDEIVGHVVKNAGRAGA